MSGAATVNPRLEGKTVYVTGASGGIGGTICKRLQAEGASVVGMVLGDEIEKWCESSGFPAA